MKKGLVVSDMHMFSGRSVGKEHFDSLYEKISSADACVLNGDIFDFSWTALPTIEDAVNKAEDFLKGLIESFPKCRFYFVCGNHDSYPPFIERLKTISEKHPGFSWDELSLQIGSNLFIHGDVIDARKHRETLAAYRQSFHAGKKKGPAKNFFYNLLIASRFHRFIIFIHKSPELAEVLSNFLRDRDASALDGIKDIYFGHTHVPFKDYLRDGIRFHNTGSMIRGLRFNPCEFEFQD